MDKFFGSLLEQKNYGQLLKDHLEGYVTEIVNKKYHVLKTSDNFYLYKTDIKTWITAMRDDGRWLEQMCARGVGAFTQKQKIVSQAQVIEKLDQLERGFDDIEKRISNMDKEHSRYVRATVTRLGYLLNQEDNMKGLVIQLLNHLSDRDCSDGDVRAVGARMNLSQFNILSEESLCKRRKTKSDFREQLKDQEESPELSMEEVLNLNKVKNRYSRKEISAFISSRMIHGRMEVGEDSVTTDEEFEKLILAYDYSTRRESSFAVEDREPEMVHNGRYSYPRLVFVRRNKDAL